MAQLTRDKAEAQGYSSEQIIEVKQYVEYAMAGAATHCTTSKIQYALNSHFKLGRMSNKTYKVVCKIIGLSGDAPISSIELFEVCDILVNYLRLRDRDTQFKNETDINKRIDMGLEHIGVVIKAAKASEGAIETFKRIALIDFIIGKVLMFDFENGLDAEKTKEYAHWLIKRIIEIDRTHSKGFKILSPSTISILNTLFGFKFRLQV